MLERLRYKILMCQVRKALDKHFPYVRVGWKWVMGAYGHEIIQRRPAGTVPYSLVPREVVLY